MTECAELGPCVRPRQPEKKHVTEPCKRDCRQHDFAKKYMEYHDWSIVKEKLVKRNEAGNKGGSGNRKNYIIRGIGYEPHLRSYQSPEQEKYRTSNHNQRHDVCHCFRQSPPSYSPGVVENHIVSE